MVDNRLRLLARILSGLRDQRLKGAAIVRAKWSSGHEKHRDAAALTVMKERQGFLTVCCQAEDEQLLVTMLYGRKNWEKTASSSLGTEASGSMSFPAEAIQNFVQSVSDTNEIHQGACPVIPGLMLMEALLIHLPPQTKELCLRFIHAAYAGCVAVDWSKGHVSQQGRLTAQFQWRP